MGAYVDITQLLGGGRICELDLKKNEKLKLNFLEGGRIIEYGQIHARLRYLHLLI